MLQWLEEVLAGERALKAERAKKPKPAKTAGERPPPGGRELACLARGRINWRLTWCW
jgi:hypothetical protein